MTISIDELMNNAVVISIDNKRIEYMRHIFYANNFKCPLIFEGFSNNGVSSMFLHDDINKCKVMAGAYNCSLSHAAVIKMAKCFNLPFVCVFEDDAYPCNNIMQNLSSTLNNIPNDAQCIMLGWSRKPIKTIAINDKFDKVVGEIHGSHAYIIMANGYDNYLNTYKKNQLIAADCILPMMTNYLHTYCSKQCMFIQWNFEKSNYGCLGYIYPNNDGRQIRSFIPPNGYQKVSHMLAANSTDSVIQELDKIDHFVYRANGGNLGDMAIACAEFQLFDKYQFSYETLSQKNISQLISKRFNLVYGGGGGWVKYWNYKPALNQLLKSNNLNKCIILPSSFFECDDVISSFDDRFVVFCREKQSFDYCMSLNNKAKFILHDDMALSLDISKLNLKLKKSDIQTKSIIEAYDAIDSYIKHSSHNIGKFFRTDKEKLVQLCENQSNNFDLSSKLYAHGLCVTKNFAIRSTELMLHCIQPYDTIQTDRLHVALMSYHLNKTIEMYDNSYGKLKGVYKLSLKDCKNVTFMNLNKNATIN